VEGGGPHLSDFSLTKGGGEVQLEWQGGGVLSSPRNQKRPRRSQGFSCLSLEGRRVLQARKGFNWKKGPLSRKGGTLAEDLENSVFQKSWRRGERRSWGGGKSVGGLERGRGDGLSRARTLTTTGRNRRVGQKKRGIGDVRWEKRVSGKHKIPPACP